MAKRTTERMIKNMTRADVFRLSRKGWVWLAFPALFFWIGAVSLGFFAVDGILAIYKQNTSPVVVTASVSDETVDFSAVEGILGWSEVYEISGTIKVAGYSQECTVIGIEEDFLPDNLKEGMGYPQESVMPYLLVNEAFVQEMKDSSARMTAEFVYGDDRQVICKISGILKNEKEGETPKAYMSVSSARSLLQSQEDAGETKQVWLRLRNAGMYEKVQWALSGLQVQMEALDEDMIWSGKLMKLRTTMLAICALISGLAAWIILSQSLRMDFIRNEKEYHYIETVDTGFPDFYRHINRYRNIRFLLTGIVLGGAMYMCRSVFMAMLTIV